MARLVRRGRFGLHHITFSRRAPVSWWLRIADPPYGSLQLQVSRDQRPTCPADWCSAALRVWSGCGIHARDLGVPWFSQPCVRQRRVWRYTKKSSSIPGRIVSCALVVRDLGFRDYATTWRRRAPRLSIRHVRDDGGQAAQDEFRKIGQSLSQNLDRITIELFVVDGVPLA